MINKKVEPLNFWILDHTRETLENLINIHAALHF